MAGMANMKFGMAATYQSDEIWTVLILRKVTKIVVTRCPI